MRREFDIQLSRRSLEGSGGFGKVGHMSRRLNMSFSLLRLMLCCALFGATLGLGLALGASRDVPLLVSATTASLLAFVLRWRQLPVIIFSGMCTLFGAGVGSIYDGPADSHWVKELHGSISGAIGGWIIRGSDYASLFRQGLCLPDDRERKEAVGATSRRSRRASVGNAH
jgi:hypothetical protein